VGVLEERNSLLRGWLRESPERHGQARMCIKPDLDVEIMSTHMALTWVPLKAPVTIGDIKDIVIIGVKYYGRVNTIVLSATVILPIELNNISAVCFPLIHPLHVWCAVVAIVGGD